MSSPIINSLHMLAQEFITKTLISGRYKYHPHLTDVAQRLSHLPDHTAQNTQSLWLSLYSVCQA